MRWYEIVLRPVQPLVEMAIERRDLLNKIRSYTEEVNDHLLKIMLMPESGSKAHWETEVTNWLAIINKYNLKAKRRRLDWKDYFNCLYEEPFDNANDSLRILDLWVDALRSKYSIPKEIDGENILARLKAFHITFAKATANDIILRDTIRQMVEKI